MVILTPSDITNLSYTITLQEDEVRFDNTYWSADIGSWDGTEWDSAAGDMTLAPVGTWASAYRPDYIRVTGTAGLTGLLVDTTGNYNISSWVMGERSPCVFDGVDIGYIARASIGGGEFSITNIEFIFDV